MAPAGDGLGTESGPPSARRSGLSPAAGAAVVVSLTVIAGAVLFFTTRADGEPPTPQAEQSLPSASPSEAEPLTEAEAIAVFERLDALRLRMYEERDLSLLDSVMTSTSKLREVASGEIQQLLRDGVRLNATFDTRALEVIRSSAKAVWLRQRVFQRLKFKDDEGNRLQRSGGSQMKTILWKLRRDGPEWLIHDSDTLQVGQP